MWCEINAVLRPLAATHRGELGPSPPAGNRSGKSVANQFGISTTDVVSPEMNRLVHSGSSMAFYWSLRSVPELRDLPPRQRKAIWQKCRAGTGSAAGWCAFIGIYVAGVCFSPSLLSAIRVSGFRFPHPWGGPLRTPSDRRRDTAYSARLAGSVQRAATISPASNRASARNAETRSPIPAGTGTEQRPIRFHS